MMVAEGSYPYVIGGVATWMESLFKNLKDIHFQIVNIGSPLCERRYHPPKNVENNIIVPLSERFQKRPWLPCESNDSTPIKEVIDLFIHPPSPMVDLRLDRVVNYALKNTANGYSKLVYSKRFMSALTDAVNDHPGVPLPRLCNVIRQHISHLFIFADEAKKSPSFKLIHSTTSGLAGLFSLVLSKQHHRPLLLTEHADYVFEKQFHEQRSIRLNKNESSVPAPSASLDLTLNFFRHVRFALYNHSFGVTSLFEEFRSKQIKCGATPDKCHVIPNGITTLAPNTIKLSKDKNYTVGFLGRISPEKGIKSIIKTFALFHQRHKNSKCVIAGPTLDVPYATECKHLIKELGLKNKIAFKEETTPDEFFQCIDVLLLASKSEGQPYVILEAMTRDIPVVCTEVGDCKRMMGYQKGDVLSQAGIAVKENKPHSLFKALEKIYTTQNFTQGSGPKNVKENFNIDHTIQRFGDLYAKQKVI